MDPDIIKARERYTNYRSHLCAETAIGFVTYCMGRSLLKYIADEGQQKIMATCLSHGLLALRTLLDLKIVVEDDFIVSVQLTSERMKLSEEHRELIQRSLYRFLEIEDATRAPTPRDPASQD